jgi:excisionase family DNA binding protein
MGYALAIHSFLMSAQGLSINDVAKALGISTRTVRRFIKAGKLKAELAPGTFGPEYRIEEIPETLRKQTAKPEPSVADKSGTPSPAQISIPVAIESPDRILAMLKDLQEKNMVLAAQLGAATERIRTLESQVKQLTGPTTVSPNQKKSFWRRFFGFFH